MTPREKKIEIIEYTGDGEGPWSKALRAMAERDKRLEKLEEDQLPKLFKQSALEEPS